ncbi:MAG: metallophosphoesterase, partial [Clostridia bacterium]|nr:metallophosphoesterase [Clostridia bacterium]
MYKSILKRTVSIITIIAVFATMFSLGIAASAETSAGSASITYSFSGTNASDAGYAEGVITLSSSSSGTYELYWADDEKALDDYYSLAALEFNSSGSKSVKMAYHTAIPANATKLIATKSSKKVSEADAVFSIPTEKQLSYDSGELLYTFNSYSDVHIDCDGYYKMPNERLADAFEFGVKKNTDFIVSSGDMVTNAGGPDKEWKVYETILSESGYVNPVWEADGNHDMRCGIQSGLTSFIRATGTDSTKENFDKNKPYYYMIEENTGDLFIFMALESESNP